MAIHSAGRRRHLVRVQNPAPPVPDGDGGFVQTWSDANPRELYVSIEPPTARDLERFTHNTITAGRSVMVTGPYHAGVSTHTRLVLGARVFNVAGVDVPLEANREIVMLCAEVEVRP
jgi:head-tail adaptor